jgi:hypothetical protein
VKEVRERNDLLQEWIVSGHARPWSRRCPVKHLDGVSSSHQKVA